MEDKNLEKAIKQLIDLCVDIYAHKEIGSEVSEAVELVDKILDYEPLPKDDYFFKQAVREKVKKLKIYYYDYS
jgi:hypothetical protein